MTVTIDKLTARTIAVVRTIVGGIGLIYAGGVLTIGTADAPVTQVNIGDGVTPVAVEVYAGSVSAAEFIGDVFTGGEFTGDFIGDLDGNAATATLALLASEASALETARTLWGQSFDGSANVDGTITVAAGSAQALSLTSTNAAQLTVRYDSSNRLDFNVSSTGVVRFNAIGSAAYFAFDDRMDISANDSSSGFGLSVARDGSGTSSGNTLFVSASSSATSGTVASVVTIQANAHKSGAGGTVTDLIAVAASISRSSGTVTNGYGVKVADISGTMGTAYGIHVGDVTGGGTNYAFYSVGGLFRIGGLPVAAAGLAAGTLWNNGGVINVA